MVDVCAEDEWAPLEKDDSSDNDDDDELEVLEAKSELSREDCRFALPDFPEFRESALASWCDMCRWQNFVLLLNECWAALVLGDDDRRRERRQNDDDDVNEPRPREARSFNGSDTRLTRQSALDARSGRTATENERGHVWQRGRKNAA